MKRRHALGALVVALFAVPRAVEAQSGRKFRVGVLGVGDSDPQALRSAFAKAMHDLGYLDGRNIIFERRSAAGLDGLPAVAAELVRLKVDVIFAGSTPTAKAARQATSSIPIVFALVGDPVAAGLVAGLARPGGNATGLSLSYGDEFTGKWIELLKQTDPTISKAGYLLTDANPFRAALESQMQAGGSILGTKIVAFKIAAPQDIDVAFASMRAEHVNAVVVGSDALLYFHRHRIAELAVKSRLPAIYGARPYVTAGGLLSYGPSYVDQYARAATYVDKILKGAKPADLPVEQPTKFELVINVKTAKAIGLTIPPSLLLRADEVIQ